MKGRNSNLIQLRNEYLIKRYYYWYELERKRTDDVLDILSEKEIFLDRDYILTLIRQNGILLKQLKQSKPNAKRLETFTFCYQNNQGKATTYALESN
ncbi:transposase [Limnovirga soli]|uniref:Transposase n=1 Tax=Limnovirga soli TaxID=2656915 RepID=A0A8J8JTE3_9BACT|nr:transposase [Limnovirga soli]NNV54544.1 transposase [Limnovirga soli]